MSDHLPILVAEDEDDDIYFLRLAVKRAGLTNPLVVTKNGKEAIQYLEGADGFADRAKHPLPGLFLLDLKMPFLTGFDVLAWLKSRPEHRSLPVVVLTSSSHDADRQKALALGASDYQVKPTHPDKLVELLHQMRDRWLKRG